MRTLAIFAALCLFPALPSRAERPNWTGPYERCVNSGELRKIAHLSIGVRYDVPDPLIVEQFHRAFNFWANVLDADFYDEPSASCALAVVQGTEDVLRGFEVASTQFPDRPNFEGWIAVDPKANSYLTDGEAVAAWAHEIGHLLGLKHNPAPRSLMYYIDVGPASILDAFDLRALAQLHSLRWTHLALSGGETLGGGQ